MTRDILREEHEALQRATQAARHAAAFGPVTPFVAEMRQVMDDYLQARTAGLTRDEAVKGIEAVLRSVWGRPTTKFGPACDACDDTGWVAHTCWDQLRCGRPRCVTGHPGFEHGYVTPCSCAKGDRVSGRARSGSDALAEAMRVRKPRQRGFSKLGR